MSDTDQFDTTAPVDDGQGAPVETVEQPAEQYETLDLDQYGDFHIPVKVNGEESYVPLREAAQGFQRQQDYTLKTQELSQQRQELEAYAAIASALESDPERTLRILSEAYDVNLGGGVAPQATEEVPLDPMEAKLQELQQSIDRIEQERQELQFNAELEGLSEQYGIDGQEILGFAVKNNLGSLEHAALAMAYAKQTISSEQTQGDEQRTQAKREAVIVNGGSGNARGAVAPPQGSASSWDEAAQQTFAQYGIQH